MKRFFARNKKVIQIFLTLSLVALVAGYYYLVYIPERENELIARRFRTLQRIEQNMQEKLEGYQSTIKNSLVKADKSYFRQVVTEYNTDTGKFHLSILDSGSISKGDTSYEKIVPSLDSNIFQQFTVFNEKSGKRLTITYDWYKYRDEKRDNIKHITLAARIDYREFVKPLLKKGVFDQYIVFNVKDDVSNIIFEDFHSGVSFKGMDSLFDTKEKVYTSKIVTIETGGEKYMVFLHPCGYNNKNDRIVAGLLKQKTFDLEKRRLPDSVVTIVLFIALFCLLLLPLIRLALMGKRERIRFLDLFTGYLSFLLLVPVIMLAFFWNNKHFLTTENNEASSKKILADQISKSLHKEIEEAYSLLDEFDKLHSPDTSYPRSLQLSILDTFNVSHLKDSALANNFDADQKLDSEPIETAVRLLNSTLKPLLGLHQNTEYVFWMDNTGKEISNWAQGNNPPRGDYRERDYFKNVQSNNLLSLPGHPEKTYTISPLVSRIDGKFKVVLAKRSHNKKLIVVAPSRFESVVEPVLPLGYEFSIIDAEGKTIFDSDPTENLNENLTEELVEGAPLKGVLDTKAAMEFESRHEDKDFTILAQPIPGLPYTIVILEEKSFNTSLYTQSLSFTIMMMFSFFIFLCFEMILVLVAHKQSTKLLKNNFDFAWIHPRMNFSGKYFSLFLYNSFVLLMLILFCFGGFTIQRLPEYIFLIVIASLATSIAAFAFKTTKANEKVTGTKRLKREKTTAILLGVLAVFALLNSFHYYAVPWRLLLFSIIIAGLYFLLSKTPDKIHGSKDYMVNFRLMIFSRLLLTSGFPVIVLFNCIYNFEQRLQGRLKLLDYAENIQQRTTDSLKLTNIFAQLSNKDIVRSFYFDSSWIIPGNNDSATNTAYSRTDFFSIGLLKSAHLNYNDVSNNTQNFELTRPFNNPGSKVSDRFVFNNILGGAADTLKYKINETVNNTARTKDLYLVSGSNQYYFPAMFAFNKGIIFWLLLITCLGFTYLLLVYATNKIFGKYIPDIQDFKKIHDDLLLQKEIKYLFMQGIPGAGKSNFIRKSLAKSFIFCDKQKHPANYNATFFNLKEIPPAAEMSEQKEAYDKAMAWNKPVKDNWYYKVSEIMNDKIKCVVFTHFEYKIFDEYTNDVKLTLIEKVIGLGKEKIILLSDIDPLEYFYSLKKFMPPAPGDASSKKKSTVGNGDDSFVHTSSLEFQNRWTNLLGRFANIFMNLDTAPSANHADPLKKFLAEECSNPAFLKNYRAQFQQMPITEDNEEDYVLKIQSLSDHTYRQIFSSLTKEEQLTLYDLAEDGLMNTTNYISLTMLLSKGLIVKDDNGVLMIINRSFRNFILTVVKADDIKGIEREISDSQTWDDYKYPLLILLGALLYFVLSSNPEKFGNVLPIITGILTGIPTVVKMLSFIKPGESKG